MIFLRKIFLPAILLCILCSFSLQAQQPEVLNSAEIKIALEKMQVLGSALYIAAHPDDENTALLAWLSKEKKVRTGYLSLTRGGGGQNLIGSEKGPLMSVLRTYELLAARQIDGAEQFFTRAVDFGYSKTAEESMSIWGKEAILEDMVFIIRKFQPDVLMTRFPTTSYRAGGHGHHTASAILAIEAFHAAGDPSRFPEQLKYVSPWQPKRIMWNTWRPHLDETKKEEMDKLLAVDVGAYNRLLGLSYYEIAARSRSMHKSQGFGALPRRGEWLDYYDLLAGEPAKTDLFEGVDITWNRVPNSHKLQQVLEKANRSFVFDSPQNILPLLMEALDILKSMPESYWTVQKTKELKTIIRSCAGLWLEAVTSDEEVIPDQEINITATIINRSNFPFSLKKMIVDENNAINIDVRLEENIPFSREFSRTITANEFTQPFWLKEKPLKGIYRTANHGSRGLATAPYQFQVKAQLQAEGKEITLGIPILYRWRDPVEGEKIRELVITPPVTMNFTGNVYYFPTKEPKTIMLTLRSGPAPVSGTLKLHLPQGWTAKPAAIPFNIKERLTEKQVPVEITPPAHDMSCNMTVSAAVDDKTYNRSRVVINYSHLPQITLHPEAEIKLVRVDVKRTGKRIGYVMGSGDEIPKYLGEIGFKVDLLSDEDLRSSDLGIYDAVITGVRAYNTRDILKHVQKRLMDYVSAGGRMVVQYNVSRGLKIGPIGPYPFRLSRKRVTKEEAGISFPHPDHPLLHFPNKIQPSDFNGWVQERGLYFADQWDEKYTALLSCCDAGEELQKGGLLTAKYGKGVFVYTGYSFFRQLPAGVPGALKLFVNMVCQNN